jgi:hypothetical protein
VTLRDAITDDASSVFLNTDEFAESVTYKPRLYSVGDSRVNRTINAVVIRELVQVVSEDGGETVLPSFEVHVANDSTLGISSDELDTGGDKISFPVRDGMVATDRAIVRLVTQDHGMLVLECR